MRLEEEGGEGWRVGVVALLEGCYCGFLAGLFEGDEFVEVDRRRVVFETTEIGSHGVQVGEWGGVIRGRERVSEARRREIRQGI